MTAKPATASTTRSPLPRPTLLPGLVRLWRDRHTLQLGLDPDRAVLVELANPAAARLLDLLDGSRSERAVFAHADRIRVAPEDARELLDALRVAGLVVGAHTLMPAAFAEPVRRRLSAEAAALALRGDDSPATPAQILRQRAAARVVVAGRGRLAAPIAVALAGAGVGQVSPQLSGTVHPSDVTAGGLTAADIGRPRTTAVADAITRAAPGTRTEPLARGKADIVVQVGIDRPVTLLATGYAQRRQAHLLLGLRDGTPIVGPLVRPGDAPCLNCLDLHRRDRDPAWPALAAQMSGEVAPEPCRVPTLFTAVGYAAAEVLAYLDGEMPETVGAAVEIAVPSRVRRRAWPPHPACGCVRRRSRTTRARPDNLSREAAGTPESR